MTFFEKFTQIESIRSGIHDEKTNPDKITTTKTSFKTVWLVRNRRKIKSTTIRNSTMSVMRFQFFFSLFCLFHFSETSRLWKNIRQLSSNCSSKTTKFDNLTSSTTIPRSILLSKSVCFLRK